MSKIFDACLRGERYTALQVKCFKRLRRYMLIAFLVGSSWIEYGCLSNASRFSSAREEDRTIRSFILQRKLIAYFHEFCEEQSAIAAWRATAGSGVYTTSWGRDISLGNLSTYLNMLSSSSYSFDTFDDIEKELLSRNIEGVPMSFLCEIKCNTKRNGEMPANVMDDFLLLYFTHKAEMYHILESHAVMEQEELNSRHKIHRTSEPMQLSAPLFSEPRVCDKESECLCSTNVFDDASGKHAALYKSYNMLMKAFEKTAEMESVIKVYQWKNTDGASSDMAALMSDSVKSISLGALQEQLEAFLPAGASEESFRCAVKRFRLAEQELCQELTMASGKKSIETVLHEMSKQEAGMFLCVFYMQMKNAYSMLKEHLSLR